MLYGAHRIYYYAIAKYNREVGYSIHFVPVKKYLPALL